MEKDEMKTLHDDVMEQVSGGTWVENKELVALYNKYNPDDPLTDYDDKIEKWVRRLWDAPDNAEWRPIILTYSSGNGICQSRNILEGY